MGAAIAFVLPYIKQYAGKAAAIAVILAIVTGMYFYWHHQVYQEGRTDERLEWQESVADWKQQSEKLSAAKLAVAESKNKEMNERLLNATEIYSKHYAELRNAPVVDRVFVNTKTSCSGDSVSPGVQGRPSAKEGTSGTNRTELQEGAVRGFNRVMDEGVAMLQLKCEKLLNQLP